MPRACWAGLEYVLDRSSRVLPTFRSLINEGWVGGEIMGWDWVYCTILDLRGRE